MPSYNFKEARLNDFILFSDTNLPLGNQGLVLVKGDFESGRKNKNSNEAGKSLLFSSIPLLIQGELPTGKMAARDSSPIDLDLLLSIGKNEYEIKLAKNKYAILKNGKSVTPHKKPEALKLIKSLFPEPTLFNSISFVSQFSPIYSALIGGTPAIRLKIIEDFLDQSKIILWKTRLKEKSDKIRESLRKRDDLKVEIAYIKKQLKKLRPVTKEQVKELITEKRKLQRELSEWRDELEEERTKRSNSLRYREAKRKLKLKGKSVTWVKKKIKGLRMNIENNRNALDIIDECGPALDAYIRLGKPVFWSWELYIPEAVKATKAKPMEESKVKSLLEEHQMVEFNRGLHVQNRTKLKGLRGKKCCPTCQQVLGKKKINQLIESINERIEAVEEERKRIRKKLGPAQATWKIFKRLRSLNQEALNAYEGYGKNELEELTEKYEERLEFLESQLPILISLKTLKPVKYKNNRKKIKSLQRKIDSLEEELEDVITRVEKAKEIYRRREVFSKQLQERIDKKDALIEITKEDASFLPVLAKAFASRDLKTEITLDFCHMLVSDWNTFAPELFTRKITFSVGIERGYPSFQFAYKGSSPTDIRHLSGGAKKRLIACMIPSLLRIAPAPTNILVVDELDANLDDSGKEALLNFFPKILDSDLGKDSIFFLSARTKIFHPEYSTWIVRREKNKSMLINGSR